jgi:Ca2+-binding RTX toxin-like protein
MAATTTNTTNSAIVGAWDLGEDYVVTFLSNGTYFMADDDSSGKKGMEQGIYSWTPDGKFNFKTLVNTDGEGGMSDTIINAVTVVGDVITFFMSGEQEQSISAHRITSTTNPIVGSWYKDGGGQANSKSVFTFMADGTYFLADDGDSIADPSGQDGMEKGTYLWDAKSGNFSAITLVDTNGEWGASHGTFPIQITISGDKLSMGGIEFATRVGSTIINESPVVTPIKPIISTKQTDGNDSITGTDGSDTLDGGLGKDTLTGGNGDDLYIVDNTGDKIVEVPFSGIDTVLSKISYTLGSSLENLGLLGSTNINATGNELSNALSGNDGNNVLNGMAGDDALSGGKGSDKLTGGKGADIFRLNNVDESGITSTTRDTITDFKHSEKDKIDLSAIDANTMTFGDQAFTKLEVGAKFSGKFTMPGQLFFDTTYHILWGNVDNKAGADFSIQLNGVTNLVASDFVL